MTTLPPQKPLKTYLAAIGGGNKPYLRILTPDQVCKHVIYNYDPDLAHLSRISRIYFIPKCVLKLKLTYV